MTTKWKRSDDVTFPNIWKRFEGRVLENGHYNKYRIQDVTEDMIEDVITHLVTYFLVRECLSSSSGVVEDKVSLEEIKKVWRDILKEKMSLVAVVEDEEDVEGKEKLKIAGVNILLVSEINDEKPDQVLGKPAYKVFTVLETMDKESDVFNRHNISCCLKGMGLSVSPMYQKDNVGYELLLARDDMCLKMNIPLTGTVFTGAASQKLASKAGFTTVVDHKYGDFKMNGELMFPRIAELNIKFMEKIIKNNN